MKYGFAVLEDELDDETFEDDYKSDIRLESLYLDNFKSFKDSKFKFGKLNCLIAPNNTGKSNLVEALEFLDALIYEGTPRAIAKVGLKNIQNYHYLDDKKIVVNAKFDIQNRVLVSDEFIEYKLELAFLFNMDIETKKSNIDIMALGNKIKSVTIDKADLRNGLQPRVFGNLEEFLSNLDIYTKKLETKNYRSFDFEYNSSTLQYSVKTRYESTERIVQLLLGLDINKKNDTLVRSLDFKFLFNKSSLFASHYFHPNTIKEVQNLGYDHFLKNGTNIAEYLSTLDKDIFEDISTSLIGEVELISSLELKDGFTTDLYFNEEINDKVTPIKLQKVSDGTVHFISIMSALLGNQYSIGMMIEEPERHMHMKVLSYILNTMRDDDKQIFFTTHSTEMLNELELDEILFLFRDYEGDTKGQRAKDIPNITKIMGRNKDLVEIIKCGLVGEYDE